MSNLNVDSNPTLREKQKIFYNSQKFALAGASSKYDRCGNKVLRWLINRYGGQNVVPVHPSAPTLETITCVAKLSNLLDPEHTVLGIVTQPSATLELLEEVTSKNIKLPMIWIQPGAENHCVKKYIEKMRMGDRVIYSTGTQESDTVTCDQPTIDWKGSAQKPGPVFDNSTTPGCGSDSYPDIMTPPVSFSPTCLHLTSPLY